jgi:hypothetical protein
MLTLIARTLVTCVLILSPTIVYAENLPMKATFKCDFTGFEEPLVFISNGDGTGKIIGNAGVGELLVFHGTEVISFVEPTFLVVVQSLSIILKSNEAIYSRHNTFFGETEFKGAEQLKTKCRLIDSQ